MAPGGRSSGAAGSAAMTWATVPAAASAMRARSRSKKVTHSRPAPPTVMSAGGAGASVKGTLSGGATHVAGQVAFLENVDLFEVPAVG